MPSELARLIRIRGCAERGEFKRANIRIAEMQNKHATAEHTSPTGDSPMIESPDKTIKAITANMLRADQEREDDSAYTELRHRIWAIKDINTLLLLYSMDSCTVSPELITQYAAQSRTLATRIEELITTRRGK